AIQFAPTTFDYGNILIMNTAQTSATKNYIFNNVHTGAGDVAFTSIVTSGDFAKVTDGCTGIDLPPQGTCQITVNFTPTAQGVRNGTITATDNAANSPQVITLKGTGVGGNLTLTPPGPLGFGNQGTGTPSAPKTLTLANPNAVAMHITSIAGSTDFQTQSDTCSGTDLAANGGSCTVGVVFKPTTTGPLSESLTITD